MYDKNKSTGKNGYDIILDTYNSKKAPIIKNDINALVFPTGLKSDIETIDTSKFYDDLNLSNEKDGDLF